MANKSILTGLFCVYNNGVLLECKFFKKNNIGEKLDLN